VPIDWDWPRAPGVLFCIFTFHKEDRLAVPSHEEMPMSRSTASCSCEARGRASLPTLNTLGRVTTTR
jgi:hypothetical protein